MGPQASGSVSATLRRRSDAETCEHDGQVARGVRGGVRLESAAMARPSTAGIDYFRPQRATPNGTI